MRHQDQHTYDDHPEVIKSEPVPVPGSPATDADLDLARDGETAGDRRDGETAGDRRDGDGPEAVNDPRADRDVGPEGGETTRDDEGFHPPAPVPTAFGAPTVGGAVAASALASGDRTAEPDPRAEETVRPGDGAVADDAEAEATGSDEATTAPDDTPLPDAVPAVAATTLLAADAVEGFRGRWREVQTRFVDDPRGAAGEAQGLVEEASEALAAALAAQKDELGGWQDDASGDTEQLRLVVRRYRDLLDRMLDL